MEVKLTWFEKLMEMGPKQCLPLGDSPAASIYSAIHQNKEEINAKKLKFRVQKEKVKDEITGEMVEKEFVCRIK